MDQVRVELAKEYPEINRARMLSVQRDFARAAEAYAELLDEMAPREESSSLKMAAVYLEYARALILSNDKLVINPEIEEDQRYLEDLEIAWEVLEVAKQVFISHNVVNELLETYLLLAEMSQDANNLVAAREDFMGAYDLCLSAYGESRQLAEISFRIAIVDEGLGETGKAITRLEELVQMLQRLPGDETIKELVQEVNLRIDEMKHPEKYKIDLKAEKTTTVDPSAPVTKVSTTKTPKPDK
ncbi:hypothetical protein NEHOM01_2012 [Nematocida homosporus]|uniref:uncharacterized protein n=1 Tax=Nematocida homosporus TaxID=1912981 RepID=UPI00222105F8|nr:uncharacterized protein NEHOM01_2012 [Nematocida homosporus]KAI5187214.1 hypothetical protein NEHOM01_2012 [Nematocida homosporus]